MIEATAARRAWLLRSVATDQDRATAAVSAWFDPQTPNALTMARSAAVGAFIRPWFYPLNPRHPRSRTSAVSPQFQGLTRLGFVWAPIRLRSMDKLLHRELSEDIIGAAMKVLNTLKPGLDEKLYENALVIELVRRNHRVEQQKAFEVFYEGQYIGNGVPDLIVDSTVIVDPKVVTAFSETHVAQMTGYLAITKLELAILLNFKHARLEWKRLVRTKPV